MRQSHYPIDPRVRREVVALLDAGCEVDVLCTRRAGEPLVERSGRLRVLRVPLFHRRGGAAGYAAEYAIFFAVAFVAAALLHLRRRYRIVQVHSLPDALVFAAAVPKALGARVLLDLHECMPEFFANKFRAGARHPVVRLLAAVEQAAIRFADGVITCTEAMRDVFAARGADADELEVVLNSADETVFDPERFPAPAPDGHFTLFCHGAVEARYGLDTAVRAVALVAADLPDVELTIHGEGSELPALRDLATKLGIDDRVRFSEGYVPLDELVAAIARADAGLVAMRQDPFRDVTECNKMYDFVAMRRPVIASRTASAVTHFDESSFAWFDSGDEHDLARAIRHVRADADARNRMVENASRRAEPYRWRNQRERYLAVVARLLAR